MPQVDNQGVRIHYEVRGKGPPLVLQHGFSLCAQDWVECGYTAALERQHRLILVDARGHGDSDKPHDREAYDLRFRVADVVAVLNDLHIDRAHYLGHSMGGWVGFGMAVHARDRLRALVICGAQPYGRTFAGGRELLARGIDAWTDEFSTWGDPWSAETVARIRRNDSRALVAALGDRSDLSGMLHSMDMPCLLCAGEADKETALIRRCARELAAGTYLELPGLNHVQVFQRGDVIVPHVLQFLADSSPSASEPPRV